MGKLMIMRSGKKKKKESNGIVKLKSRLMMMGRKILADVPEDVKEGHFAVIAEDGEELKRFVIPLSYLNHPRFLELLEYAAEEYGFDHEGALTIPCRPSEIETILADQRCPTMQPPS